MQYTRQGCDFQLELDGSGGCSHCMPTPPKIDDPTYWRGRADEARRTADRLDDPVAKKTMFDIAISYEQLAALAEARLARKTSN